MMKHQHILLLYIHPHSQSVSIVRLQIDINTEIYKMVATPVIFPAPVIAKGYLSCVLPDGFICLQIEDFGLNELRRTAVEPATDKHIESVR